MTLSARKYWLPIVLKRAAWGKVVFNQPLDPAWTFETRPYPLPKPDFDSVVFMPKKRVDEFVRFYLWKLGNTCGKKNVSSSERAYEWFTGEESPLNPFWSETILRDDGEIESEASPPVFRGSFTTSEPELRRADLVQYPKKEEDMAEQDSIILKVDPHEAQLLDAAIDRMKSWSRKGTNDWADLKELSTRLEQARRDYYDRQSSKGK